MSGMSRVDEFIEEWGLDWHLGSAVEAIVETRNPGMQGQQGALLERAKEHIERAIEWVGRDRGRPVEETGPGGLEEKTGPADGGGEDAGGTPAVRAGGTPAVHAGGTPAVLGRPARGMKISCSHCHQRKGPTAFKGDDTICIKCRNKRRGAG